MTTTTPARIPALTHVVGTITAFAAVWRDAELADDIAARLTCTELDALHAVLHLVDPVAAATWLERHAEGDDEGDSHRSGE